MAKITARVLKDTGLSATDNITSIDTLTGTGDAGALITFTIGGISVGTTTADARGNWTFTPSGLADGTYRIVASEPGSSATVTFTLDTTVPIVTEKLAQDTGASSTDNITSKAGITGTGSANGVVTLTEGTVVLGTTTVNNKGNWNFTPTGLSQGIHTIVATETDLAGNVRATSLSFTLDSVAPLVSEKLANDTGTQGDNITSDPTLTGKAEANSVVTLREGTTVRGTTTADAAGNWTLAPTGLTQGSHTILASDTDLAGNTGTASLTFTLDGVAPAVTERLAKDTGASSTDNITSNPTLTGGGAASAVVTLTEGTTVLGTTTAAGGGGWTFTPTGLGQGTHTIVATETDASGNTGSASLTFTLDSVAPLVSEKLANDTGTPSDNITSDPTLTGKAEANSVVTLREGTTVRGTTTADAAGNWTLAPTGLTQGSHTILASDTDLAGNTGTASLTFTLDGVAPAVTERLAKDTGASSTDNITSNPTLTGGGAASAVVTLTEGTQMIGTTTADAAGSWTFAPSGLAQGAHTIVTSETDASGNTGSASLTFTLDTVAPVVTEKLANDTGTPGDNVTSDPTLTGTADANAVVTLQEGTTVLGTTTADATGNWTLAPTGLTQGSHTILASDTDLAGNTGTASLTFTLLAGKTITSSVGGPVTLTSPSTDNPLTITSTGSVNSTGPGVDGIDGTTATAWSITNDGTVTSTGGNGISLAGAGTVRNGPTSGSAASISGSILGIAISGAGTIANSGRVFGNEGIRLSTGGSVSNTSTGSITASGTVGGGFGIGAGIYIAHASGTVTNDGVISGGAYGVAMSAGGSVTNTASIAGGEDGVIITGAVGTISNSGQIIASVDDGIGMFAGGNVTNAAGALISGTGTLSAGVFITGGVGSVSNSGRITTNGGKFGVLLTSSGGTVSNTASASIEGYTAGVLINGKAGTVTNAGSITASGAAGVDLETGGNVGNQTGGSISGSTFGVFIAGGPGTVTNSGAISSTKYGAVALMIGDSVTNNASGSISGGTSGVYFGNSAAGNIVNFGTIRAKATGGAGINFALGGAVTNAAAAMILGDAFGVFATGGAGTVANSGDISGSHGVGLEAGGNLTNYAGATITGTVAGVVSQGRSVTVSNAGSISATASGGAALDIEAGGSITNAAGGAIIGASFGMFITGGSGTVVNAGSIAGTNNIGIDLSAGGNVSNAAGASISASGIGVAVYGSGGTVTNAGTISGSFAAVDFGNSANNRLVVEPGAVFNGKILAGSGSNTLELAQGVSAGTIGGIGSSFAGFGTVVVDSGANWTLTGSNTAGTVLNNGTLAIASGANASVTSAIDPASAGVFELGSSALLEIAADSGSAHQIAFLAPSEVIIDKASLFGTQVGQSTYTGPLLEDFGAGDSIDLKDVGFTGITLDYTSSSGLLQVASGGAGVASLLFQNSSLGSGTFQSADDGSGHTLITFA